MVVTATDEDRRVAVEGLDRLAGFATGIEFATLPEDVTRRARHVLLNNAGCALLGSENVRLERLDTLTAFFGDADEATVIGTGRRTSAPVAAMINAARINATELSEGVSKGSVHPGTVIVPAVLAEGERIGAAGRDLVRAVVVGYEVLIRVAWALSHDPDQPADTIQAQSLHQGWYPPAVLGGFGAAAAVGVLHGLSRQEMVEAFGIVGNLAPTTTFASFRGGADVKPLGSGWSSALGILAARLAKEGLTGGGPEIAADLFPLLVTPIDYGCLTAGLGETWEIMSLDIKFIAAGPVQSEIECALQLRAAEEFDVADIERIEVDTNARTMLCNRRRPTTPSGAKSSAAYGVAQALLGRSRADLVTRAFEPDVITRDDWHRLADKVEMRLDAEFDRTFETNPPRFRPSRLTLTMRDGHRIVHRVEGFHGLPGFPPSEADFVAKYRSLAGRSFTEPAVDEQVDRLLAIDTVDDVGSVVRLLTPEKPRPGSEDHETTAV
ncbi:MmgE/PrpD family protein [Pseudonocardia sp. C8]|uniref:MmgE/PrpD family protein n=1 Tax=Pseudonocardia sp. C8 TaxID=2762759 RepID=UPI001642D380|nr:MmgE/PrpD family protein [Pseudonocardia sp. C8]MBC3191784.1 MmgE/PrpD family protein [Pseudonocardia sp. C8]